MPKPPARGFTIIEVIIVVSLIGLIVIPLIFSSRQVGRLQGLRTSASILTDDFRSVKAASHDAKDKKSWGIRSSSPVAYEIVSKNQTETFVNQTKHLENGVSFESDFTVWFQIATGQSESNSAIVLTNNSGQRYQLFINTEGSIETKQL